ncbi:MAG: hypothetical protein KGL39_13500 [Patescibacteria group bacterium]|nr:hypothetical protein [Patescibacteria group bacterium]
MLSYLAQRFWQGLVRFLRHWYRDGFRQIASRTFEILASLDQTFALKVNFRLFFTPLYQDRSFIGYVLGFFFRLFRVLIGGILYLIVLAAGAGLYLAWAALPIFFLYKVIISLR